MAKLTIETIDQPTHTRITLASAYHAESIKEFTIKSVKLRIALSKLIPPGALELPNAPMVDRWWHDAIEEHVYTLPNGDTLTPRDMLNMMGEILSDSHLREYVLNALNHER